MTPSSDYAVSLRSASPRSIAAVHARLPIHEVSRSFGRYLDQVYAAAKSGAVALDGQNIFIYRDVPGEPGYADIAFCVGTKAPFVAAGNVQPTEVPVGEVATTTHVGSYGRIGLAHQAIIDWCREHGRLPATTRWEVYGHWTEDEARLRTDVFHLLTPGRQR